MQKSILFLIFIIGSIALHAQKIRLTDTDASHWLRFRNATLPSKTAYLDKMSKQLSFEQADWIQVNFIQDQLGWKHSKYQRFYKGVKVLGALTILHEYNDKIHKVNGYNIGPINLNTTPVITPNMAILIGMNHMHAMVYSWEDEASENAIKVLDENESATYYPSPELCIIDNNFPMWSNQFRLCYQLELNATLPIGRQRVLVDALSGEVIQSINLLHAQSIEGIAMTKYSGEQKIITDSIDQNRYILRDVTRGQYIWTVNKNTSDTTNFYDDNNIWNNVNMQQDEVATDAHFGAQKTFDFLLNNFNHISYDNKGSKIISKVHVGRDFNNAFWDGRSMNYGDGDGINYGPFVSLDICGHEIAHGLTDHSARLIYLGESGALNESFSDIFGKSIEHTYLPQTFSWQLGDQVALNKDSQFRSMKSPNKYYHPQYYKGAYWEFSDYDQGGVHINSGVLNHWYYLLCEGAIGINEKKEPFSVEAIGFDASIQIAYRMLTMYLTPTSQYADAYFASLNATEDLYGFCSREYKAVKQAWHAVGFDQALENNDLAISFRTQQVDACSFDPIYVEITIINNSCNTTFPAGSSIEVGFRYNNYIPISNAIRLDHPLRPNDTIHYVFANEVKVKRIGPQKITSWISSPIDPNTANDTVKNYFEYLTFQNADFELVRVHSFPDLICLDRDKIFTTNDVIFHGCDTLAANTVIPYLVIIGGDTSVQYHKLRSSLPPGGSFQFTVKTTYQEAGFSDGKIILDFPDDPNPKNNFKELSFFKMNSITEDYTESFIGGRMDSSQMLITSNIENYRQIQPSSDGAYQLVLSGHLSNSNSEELVIRSHPKDFIFFKLNTRYVTNLSYCANLTAMDDPILSFDLAQTEGTLDYSKFGIPSRFGTMVAIYIESNRYGEIIIHPDKNGEFIHHEIDLSPFKNRKNIDIHIRCLGLGASIDKNTGVILKNGDNNIIDNIKLYNNTTTSNKIQYKINNGDWTISPNPTLNQWELNLPESPTLESQLWKIQIIDVSGNIQKQFLINNKRNISVGKSLKPGMYFIRIINTKSKSFKIQKVIKI